MTIKKIFIIMLSFIVLFWKKKILIGPNSQGVICPGKSKLGIIPNNVCIRGHVGVISRSGSLTYEISKHLSDSKLGQSTVIGIGGDPIPGTNFIDVLALFEKDPQTEIIVMVGEIGGTAEDEAAERALKPPAGIQRVQGHKKRDIYKK